MRKSKQSDEKQDFPLTLPEINPAHPLARQPNCFAAHNINDKKMKINLFGVFIFWTLISLNPSPVSAQNDSLSVYMKTAAENNPGVKAAFNAYQAALQKAAGAGAYNDPQLEIGAFIEPMMIVDGRQRASFQIMQMFPWFGTAKAQRTEAQSMAQMVYEEFRITKDQLLEEVCTQWFTLILLQQKRDNLRMDRDLLLELENISLVRFASPVGASSAPSVSQEPSVAPPATSPPTGSAMRGMSMGSRAKMPPSPAETTGGMMQNPMPSMANTTGGMSEILRLRMEILETESNIESLTGEIEAGKILFNALVGRDPGSDVVIPDSLGQLPFRWDETTTQAILQRQNPTLAMLHAEEVAYKAQAVMNRRMSYPMIGIGLQYMLIDPPLPVAEPVHGMSDAGSETSMRGKDMLMPMLSISLPLFRGKYKTQARETDFLRQANRERQIDVLRRMEAEIHQSGVEIANAVRRIDLYRKQSELAQTAYRLVLTDFSSGRSDLDAVIQIRRQLLDYRIRTAETIADYNKKVVHIRTLISFEEN
jgi:outer membrane protein TolC